MHPSLLVDGPMLTASGCIYTGLMAEDDATAIDDVAPESELCLNFFPTCLLGRLPQLLVSTALHHHFPAVARASLTKGVGSYSALFSRYCWRSSNWKVSLAKIKPHCLLETWIACGVSDTGGRPRFRVPVAEGLVGSVFSLVCLPSSGTANTGVLK